MTAKWLLIRLMTRLAVAGRNARGAGRVDVERMQRLHRQVVAPKKSPAQGGHELNEHTLTPVRMLLLVTWAARSPHGHQRRLVILTDCIHATDRVVEFRLQFRLSGLRVGKDRRIALDDRADRVE